MLWHTHYVLSFTQSHRLHLFLKSLNVLNRSYGKENVLNIKNWQPGLVTRWLLIFFADSFTNPAKPAESNNRQPYWPHVKRRPKNRADQQMDFCLFLLCFRIYSCHCFVAAPHWLASIDGSSVFSGDDSFCLDNLIYMCWAARGNCGGIGQAPFVNEWARNWYTCSKNACVGRILSRKSEGYEKVRIVTLC